MFNDNRPLKDLNLILINIKNHTFFVVKMRNSYSYFRFKKHLSCLNIMIHLFLAHAWLVTCVKLKNIQFVVPCHHEYKLVVFKTCFSHFQAIVGACSRHYFLYPLHIGWGEEVHWLARTPFVRPSELKQVVCVCLQ